MVSVQICARRGVCLLELWAVVGGVGGVVPTCKA